MPTDKHLYMTFPNDDALRPFHHNAHPNAYVYVVAWNLDGEEIVKVGFTQRPARWRRFVRRGAAVQIVIRAPFYIALALESFLHDALAREPAGFRTKEEADLHLGPGSSGWVECYRTRSAAVLTLIEGVTGNALVQN